jgi:nucleoid-associated protein YgaU
MRRTARALGATILLAGLLIGIPLGLATTIGNPLDSWPAIKAGDASARVVIDLLAAVVWLCWAQFAAATLLEAWAAARHVSLPTHVPFIFSGGRQLARSLIVAAFMLGPALASSVTPPAGHAGPPPHPPAATATTAIAETAAAEGPNPPTRSAAAHTAPSTVTPTSSDGWVFTVRADGLRTLWDLADTYLGDGQRWHEIWTLNAGRQQPDGAIMTNPALLRPGWTVVMPTHTGPTAAAPSGEVLVQPGDTLSDIAAEHGLDSWQPMWQTNAGRAEPTGDRFTDPNLIRPGWRLRLPTPTAGRPHPPRPTTTATPHHRAAPNPTPAARPPRAGRPSRPRPPAGHHDPTGEAANR